MKEIEINGQKCAIQAYNQDFCNLSPIQDNHVSYDKKLGNIRIVFYNNKITTEGKENPYWKEFVKNIDVDDVKRKLKL